MSSEYYTLEKAAEVLGLPTAEINRLREKSLLRAFRDGSSWKFRKVDVDNYLADMIKSRSKGADNTVSGDSDFDLLSMDDEVEESPTLLADSPSFDTLMEDGLSLDDAMVDAPVSLEKKAAIDDDLVFGDDDGLNLASDSGLSLLDGSGGLSLTKGKKPATSSSDVDLALGDDLILADSGSSADLAGDSGLSLLDDNDIELQPADQGGSDVMLELADDDDILSLIDDDDSPVSDATNTIAIPIEDDFQLTPSADNMIDDSDSASQVIALDDDNVFSPVDSGTPDPSADIFGGAGLADDSSFGAAPDATTPAGDSPFGAAGGAPFSGPQFGNAPQGEFVASSPTFTPTPTSTEANYPPLVVTGLVLTAVLMILPGIMLFDLILHMWSWNEPFVINSGLIDMLAKMFGIGK